MLLKIISDDVTTVIGHVTRISSCRNDHYVELRIASDRSGNEVKWLFRGDRAYLLNDDGRCIQTYSAPAAETITLYAAPAKTITADFALPPNITWCGQIIGKCHRPESCACTTVHDMKLEAVEKCPYFIADKVGLEAARRANETQKHD